MAVDRKIRTFHITTFGCQMNLADSSTLASTLISRGYRRVQTEPEADLLIFNTCTVRDKAEERLIGRLGEVQKYRAGNPNLKVAVVGCVAQRMGEDLLAKAPQVDYALGTDRVFELPDVIEGVEGSSRVMTAFGHEDIDLIVPSQESKFSAFVTISRGCNNFCTYCIVPYVRGRERAHSPAAIISSIDKMAGEGVAEITLLGQNVNSYRHGEVEFPDLLKQIVNETEVPRVRFMTSHPKDLSHRLVDIMAENQRIMPHIHLPLQSGSNSVLKAMGRVYTIEHYLKTVEYIRSCLKYVSITTDLMVGFPGESDSDYEETLEVVRQIRYDSAFMFRYSVRPGTKAAEGVDDVAEEVKIARLNKLIAMQQKIGHEQNQREVGRTVFGLVEGVSRRDELKLRARTEGNKTILFDSSDDLTGKVVPITVLSADAFTLHGKLEELH